MTMTLTPEQERAIRNAIQAGVVRSVDEFIETAIEALPHRESSFDKAAAAAAVARIRELRKGVEARFAGDVAPGIRSPWAQVLMKAFVLDVSACMPWCCEDETTRASEEMLDWAREGSELHVPSLWGWEILNVSVWPSNGAG
jgi:Arc/MetJ-type ribon-helix-helix transcriptional regulator